MKHEIVLSSDTNYLEYTMPCTLSEELLNSSKALLKVFLVPLFPVNYFWMYEPLK